MENNIFSKKLEILFSEWDKNISSIQNLDKLIFSIRGWAISIISAIIGYSHVNEKVEINIYAILLVLMFWYLDALYKSFQRVFIKRVEEIEEYLSSENFDLEFQNNSKPSIKTPSTAEGFSSDRGFNSRLKSVLKAATIRNVSVTYVFLLLVILFSMFVQNCILK